MCSKKYFVCVLLIALSSMIFGCAEELGRIDSACMARYAGSYPDQETSPYVLPWQAGETYLVGQGNCTTFSHTVAWNQQFAYDFMLPIGAPILAARGGTVTAVVDNFSDGTRISGEENYIFIEHDDGSVARYIHLTTMGALFDVGESVAQGEVIARSGDSGRSTAPHLHFDVLDGSCIPRDSDLCNSLPITFSNTSDHPNGLVEMVSYTALGSII